jgi:DNA-binding transcriptional LysR family regulator
LGAEIDEAMHLIEQELPDRLQGFYLYYPQRRHASPALRALVNFLQRARRA